MFEDSGSVCQGMFGALGGWGEVLSNERFASTPMAHVCDVDVHVGIGNSLNPQPEKLNPQP